MFSLRAYVHPEQFDDVTRALHAHGGARPCACGSRSPTQPDHPRGYRAPILPILATVGLVRSVAFLTGFVPSSQFGSGSTVLYVLIIGGGLLVLDLLIPFLFLRLRKPSWKNAVPAPADDEG